MDVASANVAALVIELESRIKDDGRIVKDGLIFEKDTGYRIKDDGRVVKDGLLFEKDTGYRFKK